mmetsp:Transcript_2586/g.9409  ORF Transcript_2586/g.9409 Transcript_2586/m.9409 type:complete len:232 (+) Transcript_2586:427-1122(+)
MIHDHQPRCSLWYKSYNAYAAHIGYNAYDKNRIASASCLAVSLFNALALGAMRTRGKNPKIPPRSTETSIAFVTFQNSITVPVKEENKIIHDVSLSSRYNNMINCMTAFKDTERALKPSMLLFDFQNDTSFLNAKMSNNVCNRDTTAVTASNTGLPSKNIFFIWSASFTPETPKSRCCCHVRVVVSCICHFTMCNGATSNFNFKSSSPPSPSPMRRKYDSSSQNSLKYTVG